MLCTYLAGVYDSLSALCENDKIIRAAHSETLIVPGIMNGMNPHPGETQFQNVQL